MQAKHHEAKDLITTAVLVVLVGLVGLGGAIRLAQSAAELGPQVGDILTFEPDAHDGHDTATEVTARRDGQPNCVLVTGVLRRLGGSLVIEARTPLPKRQYRVHWAGVRSSDGPDSCGASAELVIGNNTLEILAMTAGGYGASRKQLAPASK